MDWGIIGGGLLGMTLAWELSKAGHQVSLFEAGSEPGGLASAWQIGDVTWDRHYHVTLYSDTALRGLLTELGLEADMRWNRTSTGFFAKGKLCPFSSPLDFARFPLLNPLEKLRFALGIYQVSRLNSPFGLDDLTVEEWLTRISGRAVFEKIWQPLLRAKLGDDYRSTAAPFMWATIQRLYAARRAGMGDEKFGYLPGGYARMLNTFTSALKRAGVEVVLNAPAREIRVGPDARPEVQFRDPGMGKRRFDRVAITAPAALAADLCPQLDPAQARLMREVSYLGIVCVSLLLTRPLSSYYITNIADSAIPLTGVIEMSALVDRAEFGGHSLVYLPRYVRPGDAVFDRADDEIEREFLAALRRLHPDLKDNEIVACRVSRARHVFPRPVPGGAARVPPIDTSLPGIHTLNSAHIGYGTLNVNETVQLAQKHARRFHEIASSQLAA